MGFMLQTFAFMLLIAVSSGTDDATQQKCEQLTSFATRAVEELSKLKAFPKYKLMVQGMLKIDMTNTCQRKEVLCKMAGATNLIEFYEALPTGAMNFERFAAIYKRTVKELSETAGGYTNEMRINSIRMDMLGWKQQLKEGNTLQEVTDLPTLTHFLQVMQVKYGSRWMSLLLRIKHQQLLIKDPEEFAQKLFESRSRMESYTQMERVVTQKFIGVFTGNDPMIYQNHGYEHLLAEGVELLGDLGFFFYLIY